MRHGHPAGRVGREAKARVLIPGYLPEGAGKIEEEISFRGIGVNRTLVRSFAEPPDHRSPGSVAPLRWGPSRATRRRLAMAGSVAVSVLLLLEIGASAAGGGSGYNLYFEQKPTTSNLDIALTELTTSYSTGPNLTCSLVVAGTLDLSSSDYGYTVYFDGNTTTDSTAYASFSDNTTGVLVRIIGSAWYGYTEIFQAEDFDLSEAGSTLTFGVNASYIGPASNFTVNAEAAGENGTGLQTSWLGSENAPGSQLPGSGTTSLGVVVTAVFLAVVAGVAVIGVVVLVRRRRRPPNTSEFV